MRRGPVPHPRRNFPARYFSIFRGEQTVMNHDFEKNAVPESAAASDAAPSFGPEGRPDPFRLGLRIAAFLSALMVLLGLAGSGCIHRSSP